MKRNVLLLLILQLTAFFSANTGNAQQWTVTEMTPLPLRTSNNAVSAATVSGIPYVFSFGGIDSTKLYSGIHRYSYRYNTLTDSWEQIADVPDTLGKIASAASTVKNKIYVLGGYHVFSNGNELSSDKVHVYDPQSNSWLTDGQNIPVPIDDHVQCVWRDSLIYVITGWSNSANVPDVQIYNPSSDSWITGTAVPGTNMYKAFGASGIVSGDTIFYYGGASTAFNFPAQNALRMGIINPSNPASITWSSPSVYQNTYRCAATSDSLGNIYFLGGSSVTYNYNGIAYNGSGGVTPNTNYDFFHPSDPANWVSLSANLPMDLRGIAEISSSIKYIAGGMEPGQLVSNKMLKLDFLNTLAVQENTDHSGSFILYPNPATDHLTILTDFTCNELKSEITDLSGKKVHSQKISNDGYSLTVSGLPSGMYFIRIFCGDKVFSGRFLVTE